MASYAYEVEGSPIMDDATFDLLCSLLGETAIPEFSPGTGMWVHDAVRGVDPLFLKAATAKLRKIGKGAGVTHIRFPAGLLTPGEWERPTHFDHLYP